MKTTIIIARIIEAVSLIILMITWCTASEALWDLGYKVYSIACAVGIPIVTMIMGFVCEFVIYLARNWDNL